VDDSITISAENPEEGMDVDYDWTLTDQPDGSLLNSNDLFSSEDGQKMTFVPDYPGDYAIDVILSQYGDELSSQSFSFSIIDESEATEEDIADDSESEPENEEWLNEELSEETENIDNEVEVEITSDDDNYTDNVEDDLDGEGYSDPYEGEEVDINLSESEEESILETPSEKKFKSIPEKTDRYTIQITSKRLLKDAQMFTNQLIQKGFDAYIQKVLFDGNEIWYRVRIGSYDNYGSAKVAANQLSKSLDMATWVDFVRKDQ